MSMHATGKTLPDAVEEAFEFHTRQMQRGLTDLEILRAALDEYGDRIPEHVAFSVLVALFSVLPPERISKRTPAPGAVG